MSPTLTLRHYLEAPIAHSHDHAQLVFGLSGHLDLEVDGSRCLVQWLARCGARPRKSPALKIARPATDATATTL